MLSAGSIRRMWWFIYLQSRRMSGGQRLLQRFFHNSAFNAVLLAK